MIRNSERSTFRRCRQKWAWAYRAGIESRHNSGALSFGSMVHEALAQYYIPGRKRGPNPSGTFEDLYLESGDEFSQWDEEGNRISALELGVSMLTNYVAEYGADKDIEIISPEMPFQIDIRDNRGRYVCTLVGTMDAVGRVRSTKRIIVLEHKTAKAVEYVRVNSGYGEQGMAYSFASNIFLRESGVLGKNESVDMVLYNFLRKGVPDTRPQNELGIFLNKPTKDALVFACQSRGLDTKGTIPVLTARLAEHSVDVALLGEPSKVQPSPLLVRQEMPVSPQQLDNFRRRLLKEARDISKAKDRKLSIYKSPTKDCSWDCQFKDVCEVHEMGGDWKSIMELEFKKWDPYEGHRGDTK